MHIRHASHRCHCAKSAQFFRRRTNASLLLSASITLSDAHYVQHHSSSRRSSSFFPVFLPLSLSLAPRVSCPPRRFSRPALTLSAQSSRSKRPLLPSRTQPSFSAVAQMPACLYPLSLISQLRATFIVTVRPDVVHIFSAFFCTPLHFSHSTSHVLQASSPDPHQCKMHSHYATNRYRHRSSLLSVPLPRPPSPSPCVPIGLCHFSLLPLKLSAQALHNTLPSPLSQTRPSFFAAARFHSAISHSRSHLHCSNVLSPVDWHDFTLVHIFHTLISGCKMLTRLRCFILSPSRRRIFRLHYNTLHLTDAYYVFTLVCTPVNVTVCIFVLIGTFFHFGLLGTITLCTHVLNGTFLHLGTPATVTKCTHVLFGTFLSFCALATVVTCTRLPTRTRLQLCTLLTITACTVLLIGMFFHFCLLGTIVPCTVLLIAKFLHLSSLFTAITCTY